LTPVNACPAETAPRFTQKHQEEPVSTPIEIVFKNMDHSEFVEQRVHKEAEKLDRFFDRTGSIRVVIEAANKTHRKGDLYQVGIHMKVPPSGSLDVNRAKPQSHAHEDVYVAIRDAFAAARRLLQDHSRKLGGHVKTHEAPLHGRVIRLFPEQGYGFVDASDGREIYFHQNAVAGDAFNQLEQGSEVRIVVAEGEGEHGPQASTIVPVGKHPIVE
jgi:cold shock CspA family protein/ribosome-associated translation inhibitor RaiA